MQTGRTPDSPWRGQSGPDYHPQPPSLGPIINDQVMKSAVALPWPLLVVYTGYDDAVEVWRFDLFGRLNQNYLAEPAWYYFACLM